MKQVKTIVCDLDGSLLNGYTDVSRLNRNILIQLFHKGVRLGLASGRDVEQIENKLSDWDLKGKISFIIGSNGCEYKNLESAQSFSQGFLDPSIIHKLEYQMEQGNLSFGIYQQGNMFWSKMTPYTLAASVFNRVHPVYGSFEEMENHPIPKVVIVGPKKEIKSFYHRFKMNGVKLIPVGDWSLEVVHEKISKYQGFRLAMKDFDLLESETLFFGDDYNDVELMKKTMGVAMKNAKDPVKKAALKVTKYPNSQDGIAYHLNQMLLDKNYHFGPQNPAAASADVSGIHA